MSNYRLLLFVIIIAISNSCTKEFDTNCIEGNGNIERRVIELEPLTKLDLSIKGKLFVNEGTQFIEIDVENLNLEIDGSGNMDIQLTDALKLDMEIKGSGDINVEARNVDIHSFNIKGSGDITSNFNEGQSCRVKIEGSGNIESTGDIDDLLIEILGQGDVEASMLNTNSCEINIMGSGNCKVLVQDQLIGDIQGSGDICYKGQPTINVNIDGSGELKNCN